MNPSAQQSGKPCDATHAFESTIHKIGYGTAAVVLILTALLWYGLDRDESAHQQAIATADAHWLAERVNHEYLALTKAIDRLAHRWDTTSGTATAELIYNDASLLATKPGVELLSWIDNHNQAQWLLPDTVAAAKSSADLLADSANAVAFDMAKNNRNTVAIALPGSTTANMLYVQPLFSGRRFDGYIFARIRVDALIEDALKLEIAHGYPVMLERNGTRLFSSAPIESRDDIGAVTPLAFGNGAWSLRVWPGKGADAGHAFTLPMISAIVGTVLSLLIVAIFMLWANALRRGREAAAANLARNDSETRWRFALDGSEQGLWDWKPLTNEVFFSPRWKEMLGHADGEIPDTIGEWESRVHPDDQAARLTDLNRHLRGESAIYQNEHRMRCKDGGYKWIQVRGKAIEWTADGRAARVIGTHTDITERHLVVEALHASEQRYRTLFDSTSDGIVCADLETTKFIECNPHFARMLGYETGEIRQLGIRDIHPEHTHAFVFEQLRRLRDGETLYAENIPVLRKDGTVFYAEISASELSLYGKTCLAGFFRDITLRKEAEDALTSGRARLRTILDTVLDGIITIDAQGIIESFNPAAENIFGYAAPEVIGHNVSLLLPQPFRDEHDHYLRHFLATNEPRVIGRGREVTGLRKDGRTFPLDLAISEMRLGERRMFAGVVRDVTERKAYEAELIYARELAEQASRAKSEFLSSMSHEFRTPLNSIIGFAQLMESDPVPLAESHRESLRYINKSGYVLLELINDLLDLSRIEAGRVPLSLEPVPLDEVIASAAQILPPILKKYEVSLSVANVPDHVSGVFADYVRVKQIILNLLTNAAKYNYKGGSIYVYCEARSDNLIRINVHDTGIGIPVEKQHQVFTSFQRLGHENSTTQGSGIGLVISKKLVEMMNGRIGFTSEPGMGSTFWIELPSADMAIAEKIAGATLATAEQNNAAAEPAYTILYVEDNPANLRFMERLIGTRPNTRLISAHEPQLGLELANAHHPDLILLDINLPGLDGYEVLQRLRAHGRTHDIPVIAVTANVMPREVERGNEAGFNGYVTKPINVPQFLQLVSDTLHHRSDHHLN